MGYLISPAPHKKSRLSANDMYIFMSVALLVCFTYGFLNYGIKALVLFLTCTLTCVILEFGIQSIKNNKVGFSDLSGFVTGLMLACVMPINMPWYLGMVAAFIAVFTKYVFGGLGNNLFNPSAISRSLLGVINASFSFKLYGGDTALFSVLDGNNSNIILQDLLLGKTPGAVGTTCIVGILICMVVLIVLRVIRWENVLCSVLGFLLIAFIMSGYQNVLPLICSGSFLFVTVFMLSDPTTSPYGFTARCIYAFLFGIISSLMMINNVLGESAVFLAVLIVNIIAPGLDRLFSVFHRGVKKHD